MTINKAEGQDELERLYELYPDMIRPLLDEDYGLLTCYEPGVFVNPNHGKPASPRHVFRKIVYDRQEIRRFPAILMTAVVTDVRDESGFGLIGVVYSTQLFMDVPINLYLEQMQQRHHIFPEDAEDAFVQAALLALHNRAIHTVHRRSKYYTKPT